MRCIRTLLIVALLATPLVAAAQEESQVPEGAMLIILDASGSMNQVDEDGVPYIEKAKDALLQLIDALPDGMEVGVRVYGHREPNTDPVAGCIDTELIAPVGPLDRDLIAGALEGIAASGYTPIGLSLQEAVADLPESGPRSIVLISDGEDTCAPPDPCQVAEELFGDELDVRIESVGFLVGTGSAAEQQLRCIAEAGGGGYTTVDDANELVTRLEGVVEEILEWRPPPVLNGALEMAEATVVPFEPYADWLAEGAFGDTTVAAIIQPGETRWYLLDLWYPESAWIWVDLQWPPGLEQGGAVEIIAFDEDGNRVEQEVRHSGIPLRADLPGGDSPMVGALVSTDFHELAGKRFFIGIHWDAPAKVFLGNLHVAFEFLPGSDIDGADTRRTIDGALDPAEATTLVLAGHAENGPDWAGIDLLARIAVGETRWYRLDMDRGEHMNLSARIPTNRIEGEGTSGTFEVSLTDLEGNPVGGGFEGEPMSGVFGGDDHQAFPSASTSWDPHPLPEAVLIGFTWDGPAGQETEFRFMVETMFDQESKDIADQMEREAAAAAEGEDPDDPDTTGETEAAAADPGDDDGGGGLPVGVLIPIGAGILVALAGGWLLLRRRG